MKQTRNVLAVIFTAIVSCSSEQPVANEATQEHIGGKIPQHYFMHLPNIGLGSSDSMFMPIVFSSSYISPSDKPFVTAQNIPIADALAIERGTNGLMLIGNKLQQAYSLGKEFQKKENKISAAYWDLAMEVHKSNPDCQSGEDIREDPRAPSVSANETAIALRCPNNITLALPKGRKECNPTKGAMAGFGVLDLMQVVQYDESTKKAYFFGSSFEPKGVLSVQCDTGESSLIPFTGTVDGFELSSIGNIREMCFISGLGELFLTSYTLPGDPYNAHYGLYAPRQNRFLSLFSNISGHIHLSCNAAVIAYTEARLPEGKTVSPFTYAILAYDIRQVIFEEKPKAYQWSVDFSEYAVGESFSYIVNAENGTNKKYTAEFFASDAIKN
jgi:hypothetical protein